MMFIVICVHNVKNSVKGAAELYFTHYSWVAIILFHTDLHKSAFSTYSFEKLLCFFLVFLVFCFFCLLCLEFDVSF